jgi:hypothetical protein
MQQKNAPEETEFRPVHHRPDCEDGRQSDEGHAARETVFPSLL